MAGSGPGPILPLNPGRTGNSEDSADAPDRASFDPRMPRDWGLGKIGRIQPNVVVSAVMVQHAPALAQMAFQLATTHVNVLIGKTWTPKGDATVSLATA